MFEIGENLKEILLAGIALVGTVFGYYFGYKRGVLDTIDKNDNKEK